MNSFLEDVIMKKYVICVESEGQKKYVFVDVKNGASVGFDDKRAATVLPNRVVASSVVNSLRPAIRKNKLDAKIYLEVL